MCEAERPCWRPFFDWVLPQTVKIAGPQLLADVGHAYYRSRFTSSIFPAISIFRSSPHWAITRSSLRSGICFRPKQACRSLGSQLRSLGASPAASSRAVPSICLLVYREHFRGSNSFFLEEEGYVQHRLGLGMKWSFQCSADFLPRGPGRIGQLQCLFFSFVWTRSLLQL